MSGSTERNSGNSMVVDVADEGRQFLSAILELHLALHDGLTAGLMISF